MSYLLVEKTIKRLFPQQEESTDTFQLLLNVAAISSAIRDELLEICGRIGDRQESAGPRWYNALKLAIKSRPNMFAEFFDACMPEGMGGMEAAEVSTSV